MRNFCLSRWCVLLILTAVFVREAIASDSLSDGEAVVTLKHDQPCFSFPVDDATRGNHFFLYEISVSFNKGLAAHPSTASWKLRVDQGNRQHFGKAGNPEQCIEYGTAILAKSQPTAVPLEANIPYQVLLTIYSTENSSSSGSIRTYHSIFCLGLDSNKRKMIVKTHFNLTAGKYACDGQTEPQTVRPPLSEPARGAGRPASSSQTLPPR